MAKNNELVPQLIVDLVENKNKPWKNQNQRDIEYARLIAIRDYINHALGEAPGPEYRESGRFETRPDLVIRDKMYDKTGNAI